MAIKNENPEVKRKTGRPKKKVVDSNEEVEMMTMSKKETTTAKEVIPRDEVGTVVSAMPDRITLNAIQERWRSAFGRYSNVLSFDQIGRAWQDNISGSMLNNPFIQNRRVKSINTEAKKYTKDEVNDFIADPVNSEKELRAISWYMYYTQYIYQNLTRLNRDTPTYNYYYSPIYVDAKTNKDNLKNEGMFVDKALKAFAPASTFKDIAIQVAVEGKCSYLCRTSYDKKKVNYFVLQKLVSDNVKIVGLGSRTKYVVAFDMSIFLRAGNDPCQYPKFIQDIWDDMINNGIVTEDKRGNKKINPKANLGSGYMLESDGSGNWMFWATLPQDSVVTFYADGSHPNAFSPTIGLLDEFSNLNDYEWLEANLLTRGVNSVLVGTIPLSYQPKVAADALAISADLTVSFTDMFNSLVSENVTGFFAPFTDYKMLSVDSQPEAMEIVQNRIKELVASAGETGLVPLTDKPSISAIKTSQKLKAAQCDYLTRQFEKFLNDALNNNFELRNTWEVKLFGDIFTDEDNKKFTKEMVLAGGRGLIPKLLAYEGLTPIDYIGCESFIDALGIEIKSNAENLAEDSLDAQIDMQESELELEESESEGETSVGRPALSDNSIENDNTEASRSGEQNTSDIK